MCAPSLTTNPSSGGTRSTLSRVVHRRTETSRHNRYSITSLSWPSRPSFPRIGPHQDNRFRGASYRKRNVASLDGVGCGWVL